MDGIAIIGAGDQAAAIATRLAAARVPARRIDPDADVAALADHSWVIDATESSLPARQALYRAIGGMWRPGMIVSTTGSGSTRAALVDGLPPDFAAAVLIGHFAAARLLELVAGPTHDAAVERLVAFCEVELGLTVLRCRDTPGLLVERLRASWSRHADDAARAAGLSTETAIATIARAAGLPRGAGPGINIAARDLPGLWVLPGPYGDFARAALGGMREDAAALLAEQGDVVAIDTAARVGLGWAHGPFEMLDAIGGSAGGAFYRQAAGRLQARGPDQNWHDIARRPGVLLLRDLQAAGPPVSRGPSAALWDLGEGVAGFELTGKLGAIDLAALELLGEAIGLVAGGFRALVIGHDGANFSAGANLADILAACRTADWPAVERLIRTGQAVFKALKYAPFPVVAAPAGLALGGGCELAIHAAAIQAHAELTIGLVECGVGLVPGWGGSGELLARLRRDGTTDEAAAAAAFARISAAATEPTAAARAAGFLRPTDGVTMNRDRLLGDARARALALVAGHVPPEPPVFRLGGKAAAAAMLAPVEAARRDGQASAHDVAVAGELALVLTGGVGGMVSEAALLALELDGFLRLARSELTQARIAHTLATGRMLRN